MKKRNFVYDMAFVSLFSAIFPAILTRFGTHCGGYSRHIEFLGVIIPLVLLVYPLFFKDEKMRKLLWNKKSVIINVIVFAIDLTISIIMVKNQHFSFWLK